MFEFEKAIIIVLAVVFVFIVAFGVLIEENRALKQQNRDLKVRYHEQARAFCRLAGEKDEI